MFSAPPQVAQGLADSGYDGCPTASDRTPDNGEAGVVRTLDALEGGRAGRGGQHPHRTGGAGSADLPGRTR
ncbi:CapA family protein [Nocardiopsis dassonvillei]|uniref:CapA family protein n=1 Tax=Nocardiopsis dassonvillei TaxID=2014 RepID=UPI003F56E567